MGTTRIGDFPSFTNESNFEHDMYTQFSSVKLYRDIRTDALCLDSADYELNKEYIDELVKASGGTVFVTD